MRSLLALGLPIVVAASVAGISSFASATEPASIPVKGFLCRSVPQAILFADAKAHGESDEMAKDRVGRVAKAEVCGLYAGVAVVESEQVKLNGGTAYKLTAFRFKKDHRLAWLAERSFAPTATNWDL